METTLVKSPIQIRTPWNKGTKGLCKPNSGSFKKGQIGWNKDKRGLYSNPMKGKQMPEEWKAKLRKPKSITHPCSEETKQKLREKGVKRIGALNGRWKGGDHTSQSAKRRERLALNGGSHTHGEWQTLKAQYNWTCPSCFIKEPETFLTKDHIVPVSKGGSNNIENIQPLCGRCNVKKHTKIIKY